MTGRKDDGAGVDSTGAVATNDGFDSLLQYIEADLGFVTSHYNDSYLDRRITARLRRTNSDDYADYCELLRRDPAERDSLLDSLSINVTSFFRNPEMWENLRFVLRTVAREHRRVRLWSAPCSDGREPYSVAMLALDDEKIDAGRLEITATDINGEVLEAARRGQYEATKTTDIEDELAVLDEYAPYVSRTDDQFEVDPGVKDLVTFEQHDLIRDEPPDAFEVVMCRNLLIYIASEYKGPIVETLDAALVENGYLVIGMTETLPSAYKPRYEQVEQGTRIHRKTG